MSARPPRLEAQICGRTLPEANFSPPPAGRLRPAGPGSTLDLEAISVDLPAWPKKINVIKGFLIFANGGSESRLRADGGGPNRLAGGSSAQRRAAGRACRAADCLRRAFSQVFTPKDHQIRVQTDGRHRVATGRCAERRAAYDASSYAAGRTYQCRPGGDPRGKKTRGSASSFGATRARCRRMYRKLVRRLGGSGRLVRLVCDVHTTRVMTQHGVLATCAACRAGAR